MTQVGHQECTIMRNNLKVRLMEKTLFQSDCFTILPCQVRWEAWYPFLKDLALYTQQEKNPGRWIRICRPTGGVRLLDPFWGLWQDLPGAGGKLCWFAVTCPCVLEVMPSLSGMLNTLIFGQKRYGRHQTHHSFFPKYQSVTPISHKSCYYFQVTWEVM